MLVGETSEAELGQLAADPPMAPARILAREPQHQLPHLSRQRAAVRAGRRLPPLPAHERLMPAQQRPWRLAPFRRARGSNWRSDRAFCPRLPVQTAHGGRALLPLRRAQTLPPRPPHPPRARRRRTRADHPATTTARRRRRLTDRRARAHHQTDALAASSRNAPAANAPGAGRPP